MKSDFFDEGYADKKALEDIEKQLLELRAELRHEGDHTTGRSDTLLRAEIHQLEKKREEIHLKLEHLEHEA